MFRLKAKERTDDGIKYKKEIMQLPIGRIKPSLFQARRRFDEAELSDLAQSIKQNGLLQPVSVIKSGLDYSLIAGERRLRACKLAGFSRIPAILYDIEKSELAVLTYIENSMRSELSAFEQAAAIKQFIELFGYTQTEAAQRLQMTQGALANKLRLLNLTSQQTNFCIEHSLTERHARAMLRLNGEETQTAFLETVVAKGLNVKESERLVERYLATPVLQKKKSVPVVKDVRLFINTINRAVDIMKNSGIPAETIKTQDDEFIEYRVKIPIRELTSKKEVVTHLR